MIHRIIVILLISTGLASTTRPQDVDSLKNILPSTEGVERVRTLNFIYRNVYRQDIKAGMGYIREAYSLLDEVEADDHMKGVIKQNLGQAMNRLGKNDSAQVLLSEAIQHHIAAKDSSELGDSYNSLGHVMDDIGDFKASLEAYIKAYEIGMAMNSPQLISSGANNIGLNYAQRGLIGEALPYFRKALQGHQELGNMHGSANTLNNIALCHSKSGVPDSAMYYFEKALKIWKDIESERGIAMTLNNLGGVYIQLNKETEALNALSRSLDLCYKMDDKFGIGMNLMHLGDLYAIMGNHAKAIETQKELIELSNEINSLQQLRQGYHQLARVYAKDGQYKNAYETYIKFVEIKDSILGEKNMSQMNELSAKYESDMKDLENQRLKEAQSRQAAESKLKDEEIARQKKDQQMLYGGLALAAVIIVIVLILFRNKQRSNRAIKRQKKEVEHQKELVEYKNKEIIDSISYAKRLQEAILPPRRVVKEYLKESFILYKPKDIVAGDFYFLEPVDGAIFYAAADCTGHGVPGAMVSVVCSNAMNKAIIEENLRDPGEVLTRVRDLVIDRFERSEEEVNDGMDISLVKLPLYESPNIGAKPLEGKEDSSPVEIEFSGANNPLWIIRKGASEVEEIKGNKMPIGKYAREESFKSHQVKVHPGDSIYVFSDGFADQFGGEKGKKFKAANFKKLLLSIQDEPMDRQRTIIDDAFEKWRGDLEQLDDVCIIGVKL